VSELVVIKIEDMAFGGKGVGRHDGMVIFVPFAAPGDTVSVRITRRKKSFAEGRIAQILTPGAGRVEPRCPYFGSCGGCVYQHLSYEEQLSAKASQVAQTLRRVGKFEAPPMRPILASPEPWEYRNRIRVHRAGGITGFFGFESRNLVDVEQCVISQPSVNKALARLRASRSPDGDYSLRAPHGAGPFFEQTNEHVMKLLVELISSTLLRGQQLLVDAYCGGGAFARALASHAGKIVGIEMNGAAIAYAQREAGSNEHYILGDVALHLGDVLAQHDPAKTTVLLDPPAEGVSLRVIEQLIAAGPSEIGYVACNPATLARDLALLAKSYRIQSVTPLDMFPQTAEIEVFAHLRQTDDAV
jgi:23S rRNA (uracil1939-C5)-methyltransferase